MDGGGAIPGKVQRRFRTFWFTNKALDTSTTILSGTSYLTDGDFVCLDAVNTCHTIDGTAITGYGVTRPETRNLEAPVGAVRNPPARFQGPGWVTVEVESSGQVPVNVQADLTGAATTTVRMGPQNGSFAIAAIGNMSADAAGMIAVSRLAALRFTNGTDSSGTAAVQNVVIKPTRGW